MGSKWGSCHRGRVDGRCDLYALGVTLFQLLSGQLPLRGNSMSELMHHIAHTPAPDLRTLRPELPADLAQVVEQALRKSPRERFQTGRQFASALRGVHATLGGAGTPANVSPGQALVYDALSNPPGHNMSDFQETVMDAAAPRTPATGRDKATP